MFSPFPFQGQRQGVHALNSKITVPKSHSYEEFGGLNVVNFFSRCRGAQSLWAESSESRSCGSNDNERERRSCVPRLTKCIGCVPRCLLRVYLLRPKLSTAHVWVAL
jgi:hypothetical protein